MTGTLIVAAMETSLLTLQATKVMVMPLLALIESGKAARPDSNFLSCDDLRTLIRKRPSLIFHAGAIDLDCDSKSGRFDYGSVMS
jgi:hypothetical protein